MVFIPNIIKKFLVKHSEKISKKGHHWNGDSLNNSIPKQSAPSVKLALGTVQFGLYYGINNKTGILNDSDLLSLLKFAKVNKIDTLDTAYSYGESEKRLGNLLHSIISDFNLVSKTPKGTTSENIKGFFVESLKRLKVNSIYGFLLHDFNDYLNDKNTFQSLLQLKNEQLINKVGFSVYYPTQIEILLSDDIKFDLIQLPYNLADRRFEKYFTELKKRNIEIHVRSVFLQGLFFMNQNDLKNTLKPFSKFSNRLNEIGKEIDRNIENIALNFVLQNNFINKAVIGVDSLEQLKQNIEESKNQLLDDDLNLVKNELSKIILPTELLIPSNWN